MKMDVEIEKEWKEKLIEFIQSDEFQELTRFIENEYQTKKVFPSSGDIFKAFELTPFSSVKVVILGQDPYHDDGQACGLSFSVPDGVKLPPSLKNIYKEIEIDCSVKKDMQNGSLESWAKQGVLLLNSILTVVAHTPASHRGKGWEAFTDCVIKKISDESSGVVFMLWGNYAKSKSNLIDSSKHLVLEAPHPSPFSVHTGFYGCKHFSKCNEYLTANGKKPISW